MARLSVGLIGWRGMVGSVLMQRMREENDFALIDPVFFSTSNAGGQAPAFAGGGRLLDASDVKALAKLDVLISCQGGDYTKAVFPKLRADGWKGYWIDAASALRMADDAVIILDPVNRPVIDRALKSGTRTFVGGNCTVSLMMMALAGLFKAELIEWLSCMTYQAASGAGAQNMRELVAQMTAIGDATRVTMSQNPEAPILDIDRQVLQIMRSTQLPVEHFGVPLAGSLIPWIDTDLGNGISREEWKGGAETNKILGLPTMGQSGSINVDSICVRIGALRCHSQALTIKLKRDVPLAEIEALIARGNDWVKLIPNNKSDSLKLLTPTAVTGTLDIAIGRLRKLSIGAQYLGAFTVGDQLLWGAAEPLRRMLRILLDH